ncbi:MAG TPA: peroxiredoxin-like family protein [Bacteroidales bacterium]|nr:peroxiredoxin-like family protein [Bacteroidales bacterium]
MKKAISILISCIALFSCLTAQDINYTSYGMEPYESRYPAGLKEGDKAPDFTGYDQSGQQVTLNDLLKGGPVVLFFYRGNWCPACNKQLKEYQDSLSIITALGAKLVAITPESIEYVEQTVKLHKLSYTVVYDCMEKMMIEYDVIFNVSKEFQDLVMEKLNIDIAKHNGRDVAHLPVTATYIINSNGMITSSHFNPDYKNRASVKWILTNLGRAL